MKVVFVIDTSAAMGAPAAGGLSRLDWAKAAVEHFLKSRGGCRDAHALITTTSPGGRGGSQATLVSTFGIPEHQVKTAVKNLKAKDEGALPAALGVAFQVLASWRIRANVDTPGQGRRPFLVDPAMVLVLGQAVAPGAPAEEYALAKPVVPFADCYQEAFRWDQHVFALCFEPAGEQEAVVPPGLKAMSDTTGGWTAVSRSVSATVSNVDMVLHQLGGLGPMVALQDATDPTGRHAACLVPRSGPPKGPPLLYQWCIPEAVWPDRVLDDLPSRTSHPVLHFRRSEGAAERDDPTLRAFQAATEAMDAARFPQDVYDVKVAPHSLRMKRQQRWPVWVENSGRADPPGPRYIGYLAASSLAGKVSLVLLPFHFTALAPLLKTAADLVLSAGGNLNQTRPGAPGSHHGNPNILNALSPNWRKPFNAYLYQLPQPYFAPLQAALGAYGGIAKFVPERELKLGKSLARRFERLQAFAAALQQEEQRIKQDSHNEHVFGQMPPEPGLPPTAPRGRPDYTHPGAVPPSLGLSHWERLRRRIFGGGGGLVVRGLFAGACDSALAFAGPDRVPAGGLTVAPLACIGAAPYASVGIADMGDYAPVLMDRPVLRDPKNPRPPPDEDTPGGRLRTRLLVDFGNPYERAGRRRRAKFASADDGESRNLALDLDTDLQSFDALMGDTPRPYEAEAEAEAEAGAEAGADAADADAAAFAGTASPRKRPAEEGADTPPPEKRLREASPQVDAASPAARVDDTGAREVKAAPSASELAPKRIPSAEAPKGKRIAAPAAASSAPPVAKAEVAPLSTSASPASSPASSPAPTKPAAPASATRGDPTESGSGGSSPAAAPRPQEKLAAAPAAKQIDPVAKRIDPTAKRTESPAAKRIDPAAARAPPRPKAKENPVPERLRHATYPENWMVAWSRRENRAYFFNTLTKKSIWEPPEGTVFRE